ncbi:putative ribonuclease H-like domain-containing protein [Tanacetum coccineum]
MTHPSPKRNMVPKAVLMRSGLVSLTTARPVNTAQPIIIVNSARPMANIFNKAHSTVRRPINKNTTFKNNNFNQRVNTVKDKNVNAARPKSVVNAAKQKVVLNAVEGNQVNAVKASACWVWKPNTKVIDHVSKHKSASTILKRFDYIDAQGRSKHITGNMSYLTDFEEINRGYVAFGGNLKVRKITGRGTIKTGNLDFEDVYFLTDESHVLLNVPRKNNMYSVDLKNIVPKGGLTCLFAKATSDESKLWHRRLGHKVLMREIENHGGDPSNKNDSVNNTNNINTASDGNNTNNVNTVSSTVNTVDIESSPNAGFKPSGDDEKKVTKEPGKEGGDLSKEDESNDQEQDDNVNSTNNINTASNENNTNNANTVSSTVNAAGIVVNAIGRKSSIKLPDDPNMPELEDIVYSDDDEDVGAEADINNLDVFMPISPIPTTRIHKDHSIEQIVRDLNSTPQTRRMTKNLEEHEEPKKVIHALKDPCWIEAMQDELLQFKLQKVWTMVDLPNGKRSIRTKWVYRNKKVERGIVIKNKERLVAQGHTQEEGIDYDEVFSPIARIEAIRLFLAYASFKDFVVHKMDVKSVFLYGKIEEEVYVCQPLGFEDPDFPETLSTYLLDNGFQRGKIDKTLFIGRDKGDILLVQVTASKAKGRWDFYQSRQVYD